MSEAVTIAKPERPKARQVSDAELIAMHEITEILSDLGYRECRRIMRWMNDRYDPAPGDGEVQF